MSQAMSLVKGYANTTSSGLVCRPATNCDFYMCISAKSATRKYSIKLHGINMTDKQQSLNLLIYYIQLLMFTGVHMDYYILHSHVALGYTGGRMAQFAGKVLCLQVLADLQLPDFP